jgi:hypothetical protein
MPAIFFSQLERELVDDVTALALVAMARKNAASLYDLLTDKAYTNNSSLQSAISKVLADHIQDVQKRAEAPPTKRARGDGGMDRYLIDADKVPSEDRALAVLVAVTAHVPFSLFNNKFLRQLMQKGENRRCVFAAATFLALPWPPATTHPHPRLTPSSSFPVTF